MKIPQLSVFLENRAHSLLEPLQALAAAGINLSGITLADSAQFGILRLVLRDWTRARDLLQTAGWAVTVTDMVAIDVDDQPGGLVRTLEVLAAANANIEYMYGFFLRGSGRGVFFKELGGFGEEPQVPFDFEFAGSKRGHAVELA